MIIGAKPRTHVDAAKTIPPTIATHRRETLTEFQHIYFSKSNTGQLHVQTQAQFYVAVLLTASYYSMSRDRNLAQSHEANGDVSSEANWETRRSKNDICANIITWMAAKKAPTSIFMFPVLLFRACASTLKASLKMWLNSPRSDTREPRKIRPCSAVTCCCSMLLQPTA